MSECLLCKKTAGTVCNRCFGTALEFERNKSAVAELELVKEHLAFSYSDCADCKHIKDFIEKRLETLKGGK